MSAILRYVIRKFVVLILPILVTAVIEALRDYQYRERRRRWLDNERDRLD